MVRQLAASFVAVPPSGTSAQTRLAVTEAEDATLWELYRFGGRLRASDLRRLVETNAAGAAGGAESRKALAASRKRNMTPLWSSRVAGALYRDNDEMWALAKRNIEAHIDTLGERIAAIGERLEIPVGAKGGYRNQRTANAKRYRMECACRLRDKVRAKLDANRPSICLGGKDLARNRHNLAEAGMTLDQWRLRHDAARGWLAVNGTTGKVLGTRPCASIPTTASWSCCCPRISRICPTRQGRARRGGSKPGSGSSICEKNGRSAPGRVARSATNSTTASLCATRRGAGT